MLEPHRNHAARLRSGALNDFCIGRDMGGSNITNRRHPPNATMTNKTEDRNFKFFFFLPHHIRICLAKRHVIYHHCQVLIEGMVIHNKKPPSIS